MKWYFECYTSESTLNFQWLHDTFQNNPITCWMKKKPFLSTNFSKNYSDWPNILKCWSNKQIQDCFDATWLLTLLIMNYRSLIARLHFPNSIFGAMVHSMPVKRGRGKCIFSDWRNVTGPLSSRSDRKLPCACRSLAFQVRSTSSPLLPTSTYFQSTSGPLPVHLGPIDGHMKCPIIQFYIKQLWARFAF